MLVPSGETSVFRSKNEMVRLQEARVLFHRQVSLVSGSGEEGTQMWGR